MKYLVQFSIEPFDLEILFASASKIPKAGELEYLSLRGVKEVYFAYSEFETPPFFYQKGMPASIANGWGYDCPDEIFSTYEAAEKYFYETIEAHKAILFTMFFNAPERLKK